MSCRCGGTRWVCEAHPELPMFHDDCPGPGQPCPVCNPSDPVTPPAPPPGLVIDREAE
jgi:hypothetical protein